MNAFILTASRYGVVHFGDLDCETVILTTGEHGYVRKELAKPPDSHESHRSSRFTRFLVDIASNPLFLLEKSSGPILLPSGRQTQFFPVDIIADVATSVVGAAIAGTLRHTRQGIVGNCLMIVRILATIGEVALIDEATSYQHHRVPSALQGLVSKLLHQSCASWERRFHSDYYRAIRRLFGQKHQGHDQNPSHVVGRITLRWVYGPVLLESSLGEIRNRKGILQKRYQWLSDQGLAHLESQIHVATAIVRSSMSCPDLKRRCEAALVGATLQLGLLLDEFGEGA